MAGIASQPTTTDLHPVAHSNSRLHFQILKDTDTKTEEANFTVTGSNESKTAKIYNTQTEDASIRWNLAYVVNDMFVDFAKLFNAIGGTAKLTGNRTLFDLDVTFTDYVEQTDLTLDAGTNATSTTIKCLIAAVESLADYYSSNALKFLTLKPKGKTSTSATEYLSIYASGTESCRIDFFNANGAIEDEEIIHTATANSLNHFPVGGSQITIPSGATYYTVSLKNGGSVLHKIRYDIGNCSKHWIHFVNRFGQIDSFGFKRLDQRAAASSSSYSQPIQTYPIADGFQYLRTNIQTNQTYTATTNRLSYEQMEWLVDLINTPFAMWEVNGAYIPIQIFDNETPIYSERKSDFTLSIEFRLSNPIGTID